ncbi:lipase member I-like isoform X2 [Leptinotarsa decemlineata]|uniref:lipase member I-like isoform X2 n=1 Tax=Leptinotarsa decemlineata TaxID=7539 RepID=UPI003D30D6BD
MKLVLIFVTVFALSQCKEDGGEFKSDAINLNETNNLRLPSDLTYHFYSRRHPRRSIKLKLSSIDRLEDTDFQIKKDTLFIIHGWKSNNDSSVNRKIRETILQQDDINVLVVDWSPMAGKNYLSAKKSVIRVGKYVADFISSLKLKYGVKLDKVKFVGFSLGAHVAGNAGACLHGKVNRIVGLDPAGPFFTKKNKDNRLDASDAKFVQVIHTNGGTLGFGSPIGHADYFPNGGKSQNGCGLDMFGQCAHSRSYAYYAESLTSKKFVATKCGSYSDYRKGLCIHNEKSLMGGFNVDLRARGVYYLTTNGVSPYARG